MDGKTASTQRRRGQETEVVKVRLFSQPTARALDAYGQPRPCLPQGAARLTTGSAVDCITRL